MGGIARLRKIKIFLVFLKKIILSQICWLLFNKTLMRKCDSWIPNNRLEGISTTEFMRPIKNLRIGLYFPNLSRS